MKAVNWKSGMETCLWSNTIPTPGRPALRHRLWAFISAWSSGPQTHFFTFSKGWERRGWEVDPRQCRRTVALAALNPALEGVGGASRAGDGVNGRGSE